MKRMRLSALVPGLEADDLDIEVLNDTVTIRGEFKDGNDHSKYLVSELPSGHFSRVITLPTAADADQVEASIKNGVLSLHIPKAETDRPKAIKVLHELIVPLGIQSIRWRGGLSLFDDRNKPHCAPFRIV